MIYCGIDVAKRKHAVSLLDEKGAQVKPVFMIENTRDGFDRLNLELEAVADSPLTVGLEATGHYWLALYEELSQRGHTLIVLNPLQVAAYRRSGVRKVKNDRHDALWIADFIRIANLPATSQNIPVILQMRELSRFRYRLSEQIGDCKRKILTILDRVFPEYEQLFSSVFLKSSRQVLKTAVSAQEFADYDLSELSFLLHKASRGRFGEAQAERMQTAARQSVGIGFLTNAVRVEMGCLLDQIDLLEEQRTQVDQVIEQLMQQIPQHITSIPGIGPVTGAAILSEIGDIQRFEAPEKLVAYAGLDATVYQTGQFEASEAHISKRGSPYLRHALWQAAMMAAQYDPDLMAFYQTKRQQGKHHNVVIGAVCRKLIARIFIVLKEQRPYIIR
jgi:transposase